MRRVWRRLQAVRRPFLLHRHRRLVIETVLGAPLIVLPDVFNPKLFLTGEMLAGVLNAATVPHGDVLDMGTGSGVGAVFAARWARRVVAVDINPAAVRCVRLNALAQGVEDRVQAYQGDLFTAVDGEQFDLVLFNPPYYVGPPADLYDHAWRSLDVVPRFLAALPHHLRAGGAALVILSSDADEAGFLADAQTHHLRCEIVLRRDLIYEIVTIYRLTHERNDDCSL
ncbi:MAG: methyltransferase [Anaerolineae bacterium]|nr:methyltransferase [Anaerolineae bacterium]